MWPRSKRTEFMIGTLSVDQYDTVAERHPLIRPLNTIFTNPQFTNLGVIHPCNVGPVTRNAFILTTLHGGRRGRRGVRPPRSAFFFGHGRLLNDDWLCPRSQGCRSRSLAYFLSSRRSEASQAVAVGFPGLEAISVLIVRQLGRATQAKTGWACPCLGARPARCWVPCHSEVLAYTHTYARTGTFLSILTNITTLGIVFSNINPHQVKFNLIYYLISTLSRWSLRVSNIPSGHLRWYRISGEFSSRLSCSKQPFHTFLFRHVLFMFTKTGECFPYLHHKGQRWNDQFSSALISVHFLSRSMHGQCNEFDIYQRLSIDIRSFAILSWTRNAETHERQLSECD